MSEPQLEQPFKVVSLLKCLWTVIDLPYKKCVMQELGSCITACMSKSNS